MSSYEDYSRAAGSYDRTRGPVGVEIIMGCLARSPAPLNRQLLLDAGCGTGNYARAMIGVVGGIVAVDLNPVMLARAEAKFAEERERVGFCRSGIEQLPLGAGLFDGVMINQVLHHLEDSADAGYPRLRRVLLELARVLKPGGVLVINTCSQRQLVDGFWYCRLIPEAARRMQARHVPLGQLRGLLHQCGFEYGGCIVPVDAVLQGADYFDPLGPCNPSWRDGDSIWSTVPKTGIDEVCADLRKRQHEGVLDRFVQDSDAARADIGQITFMHARRV